VGKFLVEIFSECPYSLVAIDLLSMSIDVHRTGMDTFG
jgi:hypothetical protein